MKDELSIKPIKLQAYTCKRSKYDVVPHLPLRGIWLASSGSGKTWLLSNLILNRYLDCFEILYIFSPSVHVDQTWQEVKDYQKKTMKVKEPPTKQSYIDHYSLHHIIDTHHKVILHVKAPSTSFILYISYHWWL